jgi:hypothetical protein
MQDYNRRLSGPPESIADHIDEAIKRVQRLKPGQRLALHNELVKMTRDISFIPMIHEQTHGPYSEAAAHGGFDSQGNPVS